MEQVPSAIPHHLPTNQEEAHTCPFGSRRICSICSWPKSSLLLGDHCSPRGVMVWGCHVSAQSLRVAREADHREDVRRPGFRFWVDFRFLGWPWGSLPILHNPILTPCVCETNLSPPLTPPVHEITEKQKPRSGQWPPGHLGADVQNCECLGRKLLCKHNVLLITC